MPRNEEYKVVAYVDFLKELNILGYQELKLNMTRDLGYSSDLIEDATKSVFIQALLAYPELTLLEHARNCYDALSSGYLKRIVITGKANAN